jgi:hypothetical protein
MTARTRQSEQDRWDREQVEDNQKRTARTGLPGQDYNEGLTWHD